jgi:GGDEF domain-containing protein
MRGLWAMERAAAETRISERTGRPLALLMMDLDGFKALNGTGRDLRFVASRKRGLAPGTLS